MGRPSLRSTDRPVTLTPMTGEVRWGSAIVRAAIVLVVTVVLFLIVPDRLLAYLSLHLVPFWRDLAMLAYTAFAFLLACAVFVRLQGAQP
jgi:hypothetical protein